jgi:hypothetical protein
MRPPWRTGSRTEEAEPFAHPDHLWVTAENEALIAGEPRDVPADFATDRATSDALAGLENRLVATVSTGAYGVMCSANEPPPGATFNIYLVGPLEVD